MVHKIPSLLISIQQLKSMSKSTANKSLSLPYKRIWVSIHNETANLYFIKNGFIEDVDPSGWWY